MANLSVFNFDSNEVRVISTDASNPLFVAHDVAKALGYKKPRTAIARHCKRQTTAPKQGGGFLTLIPESDLYRLTFRSRLQSAERFTDWVVEQVLPAIRKTGEYKTPYKANPSDSLSIEQADILRDLLKDTAEKLPKEAKAKFMMQGWSKLKSHFGVSYRDIPQVEYTEALSIVTRHVSEALQGEYIPHQRPTPLPNLEDGRYLICVENGDTEIRDMAGYNLVDNRCLRVVRENIRILHKQLAVLEGRVGIDVLSVPIKEIVH